MNINSLIAIPIGALRAYMTKQNVTANNVANVNTDNYQPSEAIMQESAHGGVSVTIRKSDAIGTDLVREMTDMITTSAGIKINLRTLQAADEMVDAIIDLKA